MKRKTDTVLLSLLVSVYNLPIQFYDHFPDVIICGHHRLEKEDFDLLKEQSLITEYYTDSFGKLYKLSAKAEQLLHDEVTMKRRRRLLLKAQSIQASIPFL